MTVMSTVFGGIDLVRGAGSTAVVLWGAIDSALREQAGRALAGALERDLPIEVDASRITFIDSAGVAFLLQLCALGREESLSVSVFGPPTVVAEALHLIGCDDVIRDVRRPAA
jgi:anti-anti-sigma regulatory factor